MTLVGNDVVDLGDPRCEGKAVNRRFVARIFGDAEAEAIRDASRPDRTLWLLWAAKEAAFKTVTKLLGSPPSFEHRAFRVRLAAVDDGEGADSAGSVEYRNTEVRFEGAVSPDRIHVLAWHAPGGGRPAPIHWHARDLSAEASVLGDGWREALRDRFTAEEWKSVHSRASALVRIMARAALARTLGVEEEAVEIVCAPGPAGRMPPGVRVGGRPYAGDLSLSHHGRLAAWAYTRVGNEERSAGPAGGRPG